MKTNLIAWLVFAAFVAIAILTNNEPSFISVGPYAFGKYLMWIAFLAFFLYTYHCSKHESLFRTIKAMNGLYWGRQIGIDLYIGLLLFVSLIFFHQQSAVVTLLWLIPILAFGNLATLLYAALHYDSLISLLTY